MLFLPAAIIGLINAYAVTAQEVNSASSSGTFTLSNELSNFVPSCARPCFILFLENNFQTSTCTTGPTLSCLCSHTTPSGFTVGEGALQCIAGATNAGLCTGDDNAKAVGLNAYNMCAGQTAALPNTHPTITATQVVVATGPSVVTSTSVSSRTSGSTTKTSSSTNVSSTETSSTLTRTSTTSTSQSTTKTTSTANLAATATALPEAVNSRGALTTPQITGIAVGSVGGVLAVIGLILLCCFRRRRQQEALRDRDSFFKLPFHLEEGNKTTNGGFNGPTEKWSGGKAAPTIPERVATVRAVPDSQTSRFSNPAVIGVAISPDSRFKPDRGHDYDRRQSVLLPPKPTLEPFVNPRASPPRSIQKSAKQNEAKLPSQALTYQKDPVQNDRHMSAATMFDEDPQDSLVPFTSSGTAAIIVPQDSERSRARPNWPAPIRTDLGVAPLMINKPNQNPSRNGPNHSRQISRALPTASSTYSQGSYIRASTENRQPGQGYNRSYAPAQEFERTPGFQFQPYRPNAQQAPPQIRRESSSSLTSIESDSGPSALPLTPVNRASNLNLSPVVESPHSARTGKDLYPPIPGTGSSPTTELRSAPKPLFHSGESGQEIRKPADLAVYDAFWRPQPQAQVHPVQSQAQRQAQLQLQTAQRQLAQVQQSQLQSQSRSQESAFERQRRLRMSQATNTSQPQQGRTQGARTGRLPTLPVLQTNIPVPTNSPTGANFPSAIPKDERKAESVMERGRPNADYVYSPGGRRTLANAAGEARTDARGSALSARSTNTTNTTGSANSLMDRRGKKLIAPISVAKSGRGANGGGRSGEGRSGQRTGGSYEELLSPTGRSVTPRKVGDNLYLDMS